MTSRQKTIDTYNRSAKALAEYFKGIGPRIFDIEKAFELAGGGRNLRVVEIGCGDGRDAKEILKRTDDYLGFDVSEAMIEIARKNIPHGNFVIADAVRFNYPPKSDIVFAFASLLHLSRQEVKKVISDVYSALRLGGVFYISLKYAPTYRRLVKNDKYGDRLFFLYNPEEIRVLAGDQYKEVFLSKETRGNTEWFGIALRKTK